MKSLILSVAGLFIILSCNNRNVSSGITIKPLSEAGYVIDSLPTGTPLRIIAWSGGLEDSKKEVYMHQFIVKDKNTGDTIRVLARLLSVKNIDGSGETYSPITAFDPDKEILDVEFHQVPEHENLLDAVTLGIKDGGTPNKDDIMAAINDSASVKKFVVINNNYPIFTRNYKTVIGVLYFDTQPW